jgi:hypothetical protein
MTGMALPATVRWLDDHQRVIIVEFAPGLTIDLVVDAARRANAMIGAVNHAATVIYDFSQSGKPVDSLLGSLPKINRLRHPNNALSILVGSGGLLRALAGLYSRLYRPVPVFDTMQEALDYVRAMRSTVTLQN